MNYLNENDPKAAAWLRALIAAGEIPPGEVDERSIVDVRPHEIAHYTQQHFFAGIGGWPLALQFAGWPADRPVRTGSCPCQPFSTAGKGLGTKDARHLWPVFRDHITFGEPTVTFGEQVASKAGREWLDGVRADLEGLGYAVGAADLCAAAVGAPHIRQRLYWVADPYLSGSQGRSSVRQCADQRIARASGVARGVEHANGSGSQQGIASSPSVGHGSAALADGGTGFWSAYDLIACRDGKARRVEPGTFPLAHGVSARVGRLRGYGNAIVPHVAAEFIKAYLDTLTA